MATHEVDQKLLAHLAERYKNYRRPAEPGEGRVSCRQKPQLPNTLFQLLGLSIMLGPRLVRARRLQQDDLERMNDQEKRNLLEEIVWLTHSGLAMTQTLPKMAEERPDPQLRIFASKLRASFYHILCLFHNDPPITQLARAVVQSYHIQAGQSRSSPLSPRSGNGERSRTGQRRSTGKVKDRESPRTLDEKENRTRPSPPDRQNIRESMLSEASVVTNPWSNLSPPPPPGLPVPEVPTSFRFVMPTTDLLPIAKATFNEASALASRVLPASAPLRLSVALEHSAFLWDCVHDQEGSRKLARSTIRDVYRTDAGLTDEEFDDATSIVGTLGRMMRRKSQEGTPRFGSATPPASSARSPAPQKDAPPPVPPKPAADEQARSSAPLSTGTVDEIATRVAGAGPQVSSRARRRSPPQVAEAQGSSSQQPVTARQSPASSSGTFKVSRRPVPGSTSPGRSSNSQTSPGRSSTAPTATSTPRQPQSSPQQKSSSKRAGSDTESPKRKHRAKRNGDR